MNGVARAAIARMLGATVSAARSLPGGDINEAYELELSDGRRVFAKENSAAPALFFEAEARGLAWLAEARALRVPEVLGVAAADSGSAFLLLELLVSGRRVRDFDARLGQGLAALHRFGAPAFGLDHDNFVGSLPQSNRICPSWTEFYRDRRLLPLLERARQRGLLDSSIDARLERLLSRLEVWVGPCEPPARLHGDLWGGNLHVDELGHPALLDPSVYGGHREIDLAMMRLFGGFGEPVFAAYAESYPLAPGYRERIPLYQLYPLLVHLNLFGAAYRIQVQRCIDALS
jgi:fructosamine-3-kinase